MPEHHWSVLCRDGIVDQATNRLSLLNIVEHVVVSVSPEDREAGQRGEMLFIRVPLKIVSFWSRTVRETEESFDLRVSLIAPDGVKTHSVESHKMTIDRSISTRTFLALGGILFRGPGPYKIVVEWCTADGFPWTIAATLPLEVVVAPSKEPEATESTQPKVRMITAANEY